MNVKIIATKGCSHSKNLSKSLTSLDIKHDILLAEDEIELCQKLGIRHSPNLVVDDEVVFRHQATEHELRDYFKL